MHACTIVARNYLAQAQVLVDSFRTHHPDGTFDVLLVDEPDTPRPSVRGADVVMLDEIGLDPGRLKSMALIYELIELATAVKPWLLRSLLDRGFDHAVYFDPDISIERTIGELPGLAREHGIVLTPHLTEPMPRDGGTPDEQVILLSGSYNLGFIAVGEHPEGRRMLDWWAERLSLDCLVDQAHGFFTDQRWIDLVPGLFGHFVQRDPSWNAAYWNLATRPLSRDDDGRILIAGRPRTFVHFSGYTPALPHLLSKHQGPRPRLLLSQDPILREMCDDYGARLLAAGFLDHQEAFRFPYATVDGVALDRLTRRLVRSHLLSLQQGRPSTLGIGQDGVSLSDWLDRPDPAGTAPALSRYLAQIYASRPDVQGAFPDVLEGRVSGFLRWVENYGIVELGIPVARLEGFRQHRREGSGVVAASEGGTALTGFVSRPADPVAGATVRPGVEVAGYLTAELGLGETARQFVAALQVAGEPVSTTTYRRTLSRQDTPWTDLLPAPGVRHDVALLCVNADQLPIFRQDAGRAYVKGRYRIGLWFWELADYPAAMRDATPLLDEIWVCSEFNRAAIAPHTELPVRVVPHPAHAPTRSVSVPVELGSDPAFTFLFVFDYFSVYARKNPAGLVEAFKRAFPGPGPARLVIKNVNGDRRPREREHLRYVVADRPDIVLIERYLAREEVDGLMHAADCYVSLHRSEGFGQTLAESMAAGKPVIATDYSGNLEFTRPGNSLLVPFQMTSVPVGADPYPPTAVWADPDLDEAARLMRAVLEDPALAKERGTAAAATIEKEFSVGALATVMRQRLAEIRGSQRYQKRRDTISADAPRR